MKKRSRKDVLAQHQVSSEHVCKNIRIRKSQIPSGGGGAFTTVMIPCGACVGFYKGARSNVQEQREKDFDNHYLFDGEAGGRNAYDPDGRLRLDSGEVVNVHGWGTKEWNALQNDGVEWIGKCATWTRFINHASSKFQNLSICSSSDRFGRSHAFYAKTTEKKLRHTVKNSRGRALTAHHICPTPKNYISRFSLYSQVEK